MNNLSLPYYKNTREQLLFRSDTREPHTVFNSGLSRRVAGYEGFLQKIEQVISDMVQRMEVNYREKNILSIMSSQSKQSLDTLDDSEKRDLYLLSSMQYNNANSFPMEQMEQYLKKKFLNKFYGKTPDKNENENEFKEFFTEEELENNLTMIHQRASEPFFDSENQLGMDPSNSISLTTQIDVTAVFPEDQTTDTYIYFLRSETGFMTYEKQTEKDNPFYYAQEIAVRDIPRGDILGAIKIKRHFVGNNCYCYEITGNVEWNPALDNEHGQTTYRKAQIQNLVDIRKNKFIKNPDAKATVSLDNKNFETIKKEDVHDLEIFQHIMKLILELSISKSIDNSAALSTQILDLAKTLYQPDRILPCKEKNLLDSLREYKKYFKNAEIFNSLEKEVAQLCVEHSKAKFN